MRLITRRFCLRRISTRAYADRHAALVSELGLFLVDERGEPLWTR